MKKYALPPTGHAARRLSVPRLAGGIAVVAFVAGTSPALAQSGQPAVSQPVVQPLPKRESLELSAALSRLGRDPRNVDALVDAGNAATAMGDLDAAVGFFKRADQVSGNDPRVKAGLANAMVRSGDPFSAIPVYAEAERAGAKPDQIAVDRGLAYDLVGNTKAAQAYYRQALQGNDGKEAARRLAISQAIAGDRRGADATLMPLLREQDKAAWRARAFALAIAGEVDEAVRIVQTILPESLAGSVVPYMRYMPRLTPAQQAAAANLGKFPRASEIGRDDPRVAQFGGSSAPRIASADAGLVPQGQPLGPSAAQPRQSRPAPARPAPRAAPPEPKPTRTAESRPAATSTGELPPVDAARPATQPGAVASAPAPTPTPTPTPSPAPAPTSTATARPATASPSPAPAATPAASRPAQVASAAPSARPGFDLASLPRSAPADSPAELLDRATPGSSPAATTTVPTAASPQQRVSLLDAFADLGAPSTAAAPAAGAVDIRGITPVIEKAEPAPVPEPKAKPAPPSHPSRIWVQIGIGRDRKALAFDWRRLGRQARSLLGDRKAYVSEMGQTNRMVTGPFESAAAANRFVSDLEDAGIDGPYIWTSPAGQVVDPLPGS
ncbi:hypothetical protein GCM10011371_11480 [Novosphingobium marinum]|uniref:Flp pilus assembly protein TadD n=1 Tax=Novosphingobium marinum TaxID=1514948 RepID=A0A7Z0BVK0_9SPHN|nr:tetratricopeptide repeat protein [Novosphingobium marinum]NYH95257.1 Flp pilus assembly protein TadD [Novosphingobium marinum]GGC25576.1 hypothetical protein GCM10011371_11480 [Novosphingobium marinum]